MSDVKNTLSTLCKYVNSLINVGLTIEHLRLAKYGTADEAVIKTLWNTLYILSYYAAREKRGDVDFRNYDTLTTVKLHLAFLQYPAIRLYSLSRHNNRSRESLIALAWLLATQDVLASIFRTKLVHSVLGIECSQVTSAEVNVSSTAPDEQPSSTSAQLNNILHLNAKVNLNLKEISELIGEKGSLISKVHAASIGVSGLPHLCVSELALTKRLVTRNINDDKTDSEDDRRWLREFRDVGALFDMRAKWLAKQHVFFSWMTTVIQEHKKSTESDPRTIDSQELAIFGSTLHHIAEDRLQALTAGESAGNEYRNSILDCPSRAYRSQCNNSEEENCLDELNKRLNSEQEHLQRNKKLLTNELKEMLKLIPSSIHI